MMEVKYASPCFGSIAKQDLELVANQLLLKLHVITGWTIPQNELMEILVDQFVKKMIEGYPTVNCEEMEFAFRNNTGVKDWGKAMNLNLIDEVMAPYMAKRKGLSKIEEETIMKQLVLPAPEVTDEEFLESVKTIYKLRKDWTTIPFLAYEILVRQGKINLDRTDKELIKMIIDEQFSEHNESQKKDLCKSYSVMSYWETNKL